MKIEYIAQIWQEGSQFVAHAMPLDVISAGQTPEEARHALDEAVALFLETASEVGTLEDVLAEAGYRQEDGCWTGPSWVSTERRVATVGAEA